MSLPDMKTRLAHSRNITQTGFTLIEILIVLAIIGVLLVIAVGSYQIQIRKTHFTTIYQEMNQYRMPYQILVDEGAGVAEFSPTGLNIPAQTKYCQFSVTAPAVSGITTDAVKCTIQNLPYIQGQSLSLDRAFNGSWQCKASASILKAYLPQACQ